MNEQLQAINEITRELQVRSNVYPKLVLAGKLSQDEADRRTRAMRYALYFVEVAREPELPTKPTTWGESVPS